MNKRLRTLVANIGVLVSLGLVVVGCTAGSVSPTPTVAAPTEQATATPTLAMEPLDAAAFWDATIPGDPDAISYPSLEALSSAADLVIVGDISDFDPGPTVEDPYGNIIYWATATIRIDEVLTGTLHTAEPGTAAVWMLLGVGDKSHAFDERYQQLASSLPKERAVLFLSNNLEWAKEYGIPLDSPEAEPNGYRVLGGQGYLRELNGRVELPVRAVGDWPQAFDGVPFAAVLEAIRASEAAPS